MTETRERPGRVDPGRQVVSAATAASIAPAGDDPPTVAGLIYAPCRGRHQYLILVRRCPWCALAHAHRSPWLAQMYRRHCPGGRAYLVVPHVEPDTSRREVRHA